MSASLQVSARAPAVQQWRARGRPHLWPIPTRLPCPVCAQAESPSAGGSSEDLPPVEAPSLPPIDHVHADGTWLAGIVAFWLNEEWTPLDVHGDVGRAAGAAYVTVRERGAADMGDLVLSVASELLVFDFGETFVNAFEVSNKVAELIMLRNGIDVCCVSGDDQTLIARYAELEAGGGSLAP